MPGQATSALVATGLYWLRPGPTGQQRGRTFLGAALASWPAEAPIARTGLGPCHLGRCPQALREHLLRNCLRGA